MSYLRIKDVLIFCNQVKLIEEVETYNSTSLNITFIDGSTRLIYNASMKDVKMSSGRYYEVKD